MTRQFDYHPSTGEGILSSQAVSLHFQSVIEVANVCAAIDTLIDQDAVRVMIKVKGHQYRWSAGGSNLEKNIFRKG